MIVLLFLLVIESIIHVPFFVLFQATEFLPADFESARLVLQGWFKAICVECLLNQGFVSVSFPFILAVASFYSQLHSTVFHSVCFVN